MGAGDVCATRLRLIVESLACSLERTAGARRTAEEQLATPHRILHRDRRTLEAIFRHPVPRNLARADAVHLVERLGSARPEPNGRLLLAIFCKKSACSTYKYQTPGTGASSRQIKERQNVKHPVFRASRCVFKLFHSKPFSLAARVIQRLALPAFGLRIVR